MVNKEGEWKYVEGRVVDVEGDAEGRRRIARKKKKGLGIDGRVVVGAA